MKPVDCNFCESHNCKLYEENLNNSLDFRNSAMDVAIDMKLFVTECVKSCPYLEMGCTDN